MPALGHKQTYAPTHVRFTPNSEPESDMPQMIRSALRRQS
jgi:hypothetical protein